MRGHFQNLRCCADRSRTMCLGKANRTMETNGKSTNNNNQGCELTHKTIGEIRGRFVVPDYQRGYRWDKHDVTRLLDDIWDSQGQDYCLQPVVVKFRQEGNYEADHEWELIDGQQRLTTLYLIFRYMQQKEWKKNGAPYSILYTTRPDSQNYLKTLDKASHNTNIDYWHLYRAYHRISAWFRQRGDKFAQENAANTLYGYLFKSVRIIWYEAPKETVSTELFIRLNIGRIPLTDAELIKATLLSKVRVQSTDRAHEIAAQWGAIERDLHKPDLWAFVAGVAVGDADKKYPTRISLLLDTLADETYDTIRQRKKPDWFGKRPRYHTFDVLRDEIEQDYLLFWKRVMALHARVLGWAEQISVYNKIGFLVACGDTFGSIAITAKGKRKSEFEKELTNRIRKHLDIKDADLLKLRYDSKSGYLKLLRLLLLLNVETMSKAGLRFPFARHIEQKWSLEHIHAQNAELLNKAAQWKTWLDTHKLALNTVATDLNQTEIESLQLEIAAAVSEIDKGKYSTFTGDAFNALSDRVLKMLNRDDVPDHTIRNMALLSSSDNSRLNNSVFEVKRQMILELDRKGEYVPICTRNVFLKYYADADTQQPHFWSEADRNSYFDEIRSKLEPYLTSFGQTEETE